MLRSLSRKEGFSLVELLITVALIGIAGAIAIPSIMQQLPKFHMRGASRDITAKLMMARLRAIQENRQYGVAFTEGAIDSFDVVKCADNPCLTSSSWSEVVARGEGAANINVDVEGCLSNRIEFKPNGTVSAANNGNITTCPAGSGDYSPYERIAIVSTSDGTLTQSIVINAYTGNVVVQ
ncbi:MAG TPA: GspH/FimT family pseudopilin [Thermodesulfobacteriota bacterium]|nr:GspH/FimT family pseudopilin [Thermodesulfobacteriota bacterium]